MPRKKKTEKYQMFYEIQQGNIDLQKIKVKQYLSMVERHAFVKDIEDFVCGTGYMPEALDVFARYATVKYFAGIEMPDNVKLDDLVDFLYGTEIYRIVTRSIDQAYYSELMDCVRCAINKRLDDSTGIAGLVNSINYLAEKILEAIIVIGDSSQNTLNLNESETKKVMAAIEKIADLGEAPTAQDFAKAIVAGIKSEENSVENG